MSDLQDALIVLKNWEVACTYTHPLREFLEAHGVVFFEKMSDKAPKSIIYCKLLKGCQLTKRQHPAIDHVYKKDDGIIQRHQGNNLVEHALYTLNNSRLSFNQKNPSEEISQEEVDKMFDLYRGKK